MEFLMTKSSKTPNFIDSRSAGLARVRLRVPKNNSQPAPQRPNQGKINATALHRTSLAFYLYPNAVLGHLAHYTIPIVETARRLRGLVQPVLSPR
jgi:hypothetical protein